MTVKTSGRDYIFKKGINEYDSVIDTYISSVYPDDSFGDELVLRTDGLEDGGEITTLIKFDGIIGTGDNQIPLGTNIESAQLSLVTLEQGGAA